MLIILGGTIFSVMVEYPNWFASVPTSLEATRNFYKVLHPGYFFQIFGPLLVLSGVAFAIVGWRTGSARNLVIISVVIFIAIEMLTFLYIYPRLGILFGPDSSSQTVEVLRQAAGEFTPVDRIRTAMDVIASAISVGALIKFFKNRYGMAS
jgi:uncharacterized membrane protein